MPGRWKDNGQGQAYWDGADSGPDQIQGMPAGGPAAMAPSGSTPVPALPNIPMGSEGSGGITGHGGGIDSMASPLTISPGEGGMFSMMGHGGKDNGPQTIEALLGQLRGFYNPGQPMATGGGVPAPGDPSAQVAGDAMAGPAGMQAPKVPAASFGTPTGPAPSAPGGMRSLGGIGSPMAQRLAR